MAEGELRQKNIYFSRSKKVAVDLCADDWLQARERVYISIS